MLLIMAVTLYTSRVILQTLGVEDYGIYNLVAGFITLFSFISGALVASIQRFLNIAIGNKDDKKFTEIFSMSINIMILTSFVILLVGETLGLWFIRTQLNIPEERYLATEYVYHFALITFIVNILRTPYNAAIIAYEKMSFYAYISIIEVFLRLGVVFSLLWLPFDKLTSYAILYFLLMLFILVVYWFYCKYKFPLCKYQFKRDKVLFKEILGFSGWSLLGQSAVVGAGQGDAIFVNKFHSVASNAAMGGASQLTRAVEMFVTNFQIAFNPQLTQSYVYKSKDEHISLLFRASKFSFYLQLVLTLPFIFNIHSVMTLWLGDVPSYADEFCFYILINYLFGAISTPFKSSIYADGRIKVYEILRTVLFSLGLCGSYIVMKIGCEPYYIAIVGVVVQFFLLILRIVIAQLYSGFKISTLIKNVIVPCVIVSVIAASVPYLTGFSDYGIFSLLGIAGLDVFYALMIVFVFGLNKSEKSIIINKVQLLILYRKHE